MFVGLDTIRDLAKQFTAPPVREHMLNPLKRVNAAIGALSNMQEFLIDYGYLIPDLPHKTMHDWVLHHVKSGRPDLVSLLIAHHQLNDALEYNAGHLLQHLDTIKDYAEASFSKHLTKGYEALRALRNYIEHGNPLIDMQDLDLNKDYPYSFQRQKILAPQLVELIFNLLPDLLQIKQTMEKQHVVNTTPHLGAPEIIQKPADSSKKPGGQNNTISPLVAKSIFASSENIKSNHQKELIPMVASNMIV
ncbi:MAG: hypothetical protein ACRCXC_03330 [Legionella sp.]